MSKPFVSFASAVFGLCEAPWPSPSKAFLFFGASRWSSWAPPNCQVAPPDCQFAGRRLWIWDCQFWAWGHQIVIWSQIVPDCRFGVRRSIWGPSARLCVNLGTNTTFLPCSSNHNRRTYWRVRLKFRQSSGNKTGRMICDMHTPRTTHALISAAKCSGLNPRTPETLERQPWALDPKPATWPMSLDLESSKPEGVADCSHAVIVDTESEFRVLAANLKPSDIIRNVKS